MALSKYLLVVGLIINSNLFSQNSLVNFLETSENSKIGALGGNNVSLNEKNNYFLSNPAFTYKSNKVVSINYLNYISDINSSSILFTDSSSFLGNFGIGVKYFSHGKFKFYDQSGNFNGNFYPKELLLSFSKSLKLNNFIVGSNLNYFYSKLFEEKKTGILIDAGAIYSPFTNNKINFGLVIKNFGLIFYEEDIIPFNINLGSTIKPEYMPLRFSVTYRYYVKSIENNNISIGLEGILSKFMSIQLGYNHKINNNMKLPNSTKINGISYGIELLLSRFIVNYSRVVINSISSTNAISLSYNLKRL